MHINAILSTACIQWLIDSISAKQIQSNFMKFDLGLETNTKNASVDVEGHVPIYFWKEE